MMVMVMVLASVTHTAQKRSQHSQHSQHVNRVGSGLCGCCWVAFPASHSRPSRVGVSAVAWQQSLHLLHADVVAGVGAVGSALDSRCLVVVGRAQDLCALSSTANPFLI